MKTKPTKKGRKVVKARFRNETYLHGDHPCMDCGTEDNTIWTTENVVWNAVMEGVIGSGILCMKCFARRAEAKFNVRGWKLLIEFPWATYHSPSSRK